MMNDALAAIVGSVLNVTAGVYLGWVLCSRKRDKEDDEHICRTTLRVHHCHFLNCSADTLFTYDEETGYMEMTGYVIMPKEVYETHYGSLSS